VGVYDLTLWAVFNDTLVKKQAFSLEIVACTSLTQNYQEDEQLVYKLGQEKVRITSAIKGAECPNSILQMKLIVTSTGFMPAGIYFENDDAEMWMTIGLSAQSTVGFYVI